MTRSTLIDFAKNQLSPSLISLSPLTAAHLSILQHTQVQPFKSRDPSTWRQLDHLVSGLTFVIFLKAPLNKHANIQKFYIKFFLSDLHCKNLTFINQSLPQTVNSLTHYTKGTPNNVKPPQSTSPFCRQR